MPTPHINAEKGQVAETILFPGDPLRAKLIADTFFEEVEQFNDVRNMLGFTGIYKGKRLSVMGHGMGAASIGIYAHELITEYGVKNLIRIGSCGAYQKTVKVRDLVIAQATSTDSCFANQYGLPGTFAPTASWKLLSLAAQEATKIKVNTHIGNVLTSEHFYNFQPIWEKWAHIGILAVEMEASALYMKAAELGANAIALMTVSDSFVTNESLSSDNRHKSFKDMMTVALGIAEQL